MSPLVDNWPLWLGLAVYFLPTIVGAMIRDPAPLSLFLLNLLTAWTVIGWIWLLAEVVHDYRQRRLMDIPSRWKMTVEIVDKGSNPE